MTEISTPSSPKIPYPEKKISNHQLETMRDFGVSEDVIKKMVEEGHAVGRMRVNTRRGWLLDGEKVYPSLSFKGLNGKMPTKKMEEFRKKYYEMLEQEVEVVHSIKT